MTVVKNNKGEEIGYFDGASIKASNDKIIYRIIDNEIFAPFEYKNPDHKHFNKGQLVCIGEFKEGKGYSKGKLLFELS